MKKRQWTYILALVALIVDKAKLFLLTEELA